MIDVLLSPFYFQFMVNAFMMTFIISIPTSLFSCFLVVRGWALMGDAISHAVLPGIVLAYLFGLPLLVGAFFGGMVCALATGFLSQNSRIKEDAVMGIVFSGMFGFGILLYTKIEIGLHLDKILFGNILGINATDLVTTASIAIVVTLLLVLKRSDLLVYSFDPFQAKTLGLNTSFLSYGLLTMLSLTIVATLSVSGIILSIGLLIAPGAIAFLVTKQFYKMLPVALFTTILSSFLGVYLSFFINSAPAPTIILLLSCVFVVVLGSSQIKVFFVFKSLK